MKYFLKSVLPAFACLLVAFYMGSHDNPLIGLIGFVAFFTVCVSLLIEGRRKPDESEDER